MDFSKAADKIANTTSKINDYNDKIKNTYNTCANTVNNYIDDIEKLTNNIIDASESMIIWIEQSISKLIKKIYDTIDVATKKINSLTKTAKDWYITTINNIKISVIKSTHAKLGKDCSDEQAKLMADAIPHPSFDSLMPEITINMQIPEVTDFTKYNNNIKLKKLPLL